MSWKAPAGRIVNNTNTGRTVGADTSKFSDEILVANDVNTSKPQAYHIKAGKYKGKTVCINRFDIKQF